MSRPVAVTWTCPVCGRRVPRREGECFCGAKQSQAEQHERREAERTKTRIPFDVAVLLLLLALVGVYMVHRLTRPDEESESQAGASMPSPEAPPAAASLAPTPAPVTTLPLAAPPPPALPPSAALSQASLATEAPAAPSAAPTPAPSATPTPVDEREQQRAASLRVYEAELQRLAGQAQSLEQNLRVFRSGCGSEQRFVPVSNCAEIETAIRRQAAEIRQGLDTAEDVARRGWVNPGSVREARSRTFFGSRAWDELQSAASNPR